MAQKARFHRFNKITGYGSEELCYPANTKHDIKSALENDNVKIKFIESNIWKKVDVVPDGVNSVFFYTEDGSRFYSGSYGFEYLKSHYRKEYDSAIKASIPDDD